MIESAPMPSRRRTPTPRRATSAGRSVWSEAVAIFMMAIAVLVVLSLASYREADPVPWPVGDGWGESVGNFAGVVGALFAELLFQAFGYAAWSAPAFLVLIGWKIFWRRPQRAAAHTLGAILLVVSTAACLNLLLGVSGPASTARAGGYLGQLVGGALSGLLNRWGALVVSFALGGTSLLLLGRSTFLNTLRGLYARVTRITRGLWLSTCRSTLSLRFSESMKSHFVVEIRVLDTVWV